MVKAATAPFRFFANAFGGKEDDYKQVNFDYLQNAINEAQKKHWIILHGFSLKNLK